MKEAWRTHPLCGLDLEMAELFLKRAWCRETASPGCQAAWSEENPALGQCAVTAALVWTWLTKEGTDAEIVRAEVEGFGSHYWVRLADGTNIDLTRSQFPDGTVIPEGEARTIEYVLDSERAKSARTRERMELLDQIGDRLFTEWLLKDLLGLSQGDESSERPLTVTEALKNFEDHVRSVESMAANRARDIPAPEASAKEGQKDESE